MTIDLLKLISRFEEVSDRETEHGYFRTRVPTVAPYAYLNIIYKPCASEVLGAVHAELRLPAALFDFYRVWNGARMFLGALSVRGCLPEGQRINRSDPFALLPFDLRESDRALASVLDREGLLRIGTYNHDGSIVCMSRDSERVQCYHEADIGRVRQAWSSLSEWLVSEIARLSLLFDSKGHPLAPEDLLLPPGREGRAS